MKRVISVFLLVAVLVMIGVPAVAAHRHYLEAQFEWWIDSSGRLVLDGSCSEGCIEEYIWVIRDCDCNYLVERSSGRRYRTGIYENYYGRGRYWVTLTVYDYDSREDSTTQKVIIPKKYCERRQRHRREISLTKEEKFWLLVVLGLVIALDD